MIGVPPDVVPDGRPLSTEENSEFALLVSSDWGAEEEYTAEQSQLASASEHLAYLRWLRNVKLP
jgi:hypothetical protein